MKRTIIAAATSAALGSSAQAGLGDEPSITEGLIAVGMALEISETCDAIDARKVRGFTTLMNLKGRAQALGYSDAEIDAYIDDDAERARLEGIARERLAAAGAAPGDEAGHCAAGRRAVATGGAVGRLLRVR